MRIGCVLLITGALVFASKFPVGSKLASFEVDDHGKRLAVILTSTQCPVSNACNDRMNAVYKGLCQQRNHLRVCDC